MIVKLNKRFKALFLKYIKETESTSYYSNNYSSYTNYSRYSNGSKYIYFYEWSDMSRGSKSFHSISEFYKFLSDSNIICTEEQKRIIEENSWCYATCVPNKNILMVENQYYNLKNRLESCKTYSCTSLTPSYR